MKIVELDDETKRLYFICLEDWSDEMREAGNRKHIWFNKMKDQGLRVKLAKDDRGELGGMIQYVPIEHYFENASDLYFIQCIWVHGHKEGRGSFQKKGMGKALLQAAETDARALGAKGMVAWGISMPFWMKASWFKKQGYKKIDKDGMAVLLWKPFRDSLVPPKWPSPKKKPENIPGKVTVTSFSNGWCQVQNIIHERAKRAAAEFGSAVVFRIIDTSNRDTLFEWGISDALFIDGKEVNTGPPPSYEKIRKMIAKRVKKLR